MTSDIELAPRTPDGTENPMTSSDVPRKTDSAESDSSECDIDLSFEEPMPALGALYAQYFTVGLIYGVLPGTLYGFYMGYLQVDSHVYVTAAQVIALPWSFKFLFGVLNDCKPLFGYRRLSYMTLGWSICGVALGVLANTKMPHPGEKDAAGRFAVRMAMAAVGYVISDVAADGLLVQLAKKESLSTRGTLQTNVYLVRTLGSIVASVFIGLCMNGHEYNGSFGFSLTFSQVCAIMSLPAIAMAPISWIYIPDVPAEASAYAPTFGSAGSCSPAKLCFISSCTTSDTPSSAASPPPRPVTSASCGQACRTCKRSCRTSSA